MWLNLEANVISAVCFSQKKKKKKPWFSNRGHWARASGNLLEKQILRLHPRPTMPEPGLYLPCSPGELDTNN